MQTLTRLCFSLIIPVLFLAQVTNAQGQGVVIREERALLTREYAAFRKSQVSNVSYNLSVEVSALSDIFEGTVIINFDMASGNISPLTLDFDAGEILSVSINGEPASWAFERWFITLPADAFDSGNNELIVQYRRPYTTDGDGLHKFTDPENSEVYLYTNFEPYNANRFFPHFDQPNLKATFTLDVLVPETWQVVSNRRETETSLADGRHHWQFPPTPPLSSYLYAFHAGPFTVWEDRAGDTDLRLFARSALAQYVNTGEWFVPTRQFLAFFQDYYDIPYPLEKYDQVIVPDFNPGAMENMGAVTFNERYISRGEKSTQELFRLAYVIAHEMAHMWFGDIVTMDWWDDLWLNESFATYMGYLALDRASNFDNAWDVFYSSGKANAYIADDRLTTHPVAPDDVDTTADAFASFDAITYQKGSAVLKQLPYFIGEENFREGVSNYLKMHRYDNATLDDFVSALAESAGMDLELWKQQWLQQSGANILRTEFNCTDNTISQLRLLQSVPDNEAADKILRSQRTLVGLYRYTDNEMVLGNAIPVTYSGEVTPVPEAVGEPCPDLVFANENDHAYVVLELDPVSRSTLMDHINNFSSTTTRLMLWNSLWTSVRDSRMVLDDFIDFAFNNIGAENNPDVVRQVSGDITAAFNYYTRMGGQNDKRGAIEDFVRNQLEAAQPGSEIQKIWFDNFSDRAHTTQALEYQMALLNRTDSIPGLEIDQDKRWDIVYNINRYLHGDYDALLQREIQNDPSDQGENAALAVRAVRPVNAVKTEFLDIILNAPDRYKVASMRSIMFNLFPAEQGNLHEAHAEKILAAFPRLNESGTERFLAAFVELLPATCTQASIDRLQSVNDAFTAFRPVLATRYLQIRQEDKRCVNIKSLVD